MNTQLPALRDDDASGNYKTVQTAVRALIDTVLFQMKATEIYPVNLYCNVSRAVTVLVILMAIYLEQKAVKVHVADIDCNSIHELSTMRG
jgi:hypothetical protein